jgi:hypothetical protein
MQSDFGLKTTYVHLFQGWASSQKNMNRTLKILNKLKFYYTFPKLVIIYDLANFKTSYDQICQMMES